MITACPECNGKLSSDAASCPHCGYVAKKMQPQVVVKEKIIEKGGAGKAIAGAISSLIALAFIAGVIAFVFMVPVRTCPGCEGIGKFIVACRGCDGDGKQTVWQVFRSGR